MTTQRKTRHHIHILKLATGRTLHVVDVENLLGTGALTSDAVRYARQVVTRVVPFAETDATVVGVSSSQAMLALSTWHPALRVAHLGHDGADLALLDALSDDRVARFSAVTICSGDGIFADRIAAIAAQGIRTTVVAPSGCLSHRLRLAAHTVIEIPVPFHPAPATAA
ncbi:hypothetical protein L1785_20475 [Antribacter sp. KLBMP9083]|uniref:NYN domain-containing protein n=1 Tax=Antribacter soli TaxID=2910976 RepID=A0AA41UB32_9MICO|nr:hypothetical protein [Antribacter soli]MCF4123347.1 hypothetical protein [Antribacter soli]